MAPQPGKRYGGGGAVECDALFFNLGTEPASCFHESLGCRLEDDGGLLWVDEDTRRACRASTPPTT